MLGEVISCYDILGQVR